MKFALLFLMSFIFFQNGAHPISAIPNMNGMTEKTSALPISFRKDSKSTFTGTNSNCKFKEIPLYGKVKFVESFPDIKIQFVESFPDIKVEMVSSFPTDCGKWQIVESFPDFTVQVVDDFPDLKVKIVESFPGMN